VNLEIASGTAVRDASAAPHVPRPWILAGIGLGALAVAFVAGIALGNVAIDPATVVAILAERVLGWPVDRVWPATTETIVLDLRLPRVLSAMVVGAALAVAGATFQGLLRNPLADPYVLGTASGAALGAAVAVALPIRILFLGLGLVHLLAFVGALAAVTVVYRLARASPLGSLTGLLLTGYAVGSLLAAGLALTMVLSGAHLRQIFFYLLGGFGNSSWPGFWAVLLIVTSATLVVLMRARILDALLMGESTAAHLGVDVRRERRLLLAMAALLTAGAVAVSGLIGFVGLVVPHVTRLLVGPSARRVLPLSVIYGAAFLPLADLAARIPGELPVGIITAVVGAPFFLALLRRARSGYEV
jgi:iron complex transport system permease protein